MTHDVATQLLESPAAEFVTQLRPSGFAHEYLHNSLVVWVVAEHNLVHHCFHSTFERFVLFNISDLLVKEYIKNAKVSRNQLTGSAQLLQALRQDQY
jgi:hypothetical protein